MISRKLTGVVALLALVVLIVGLAVIYTQDSPGFTDEQEAELQTLLDQTVEGGTVGIVMWIDSPSRKFVGTSGLASEDKNIPMQANDAFRIASNTKTFVAVTMLLLQEEGILNLDDPLRLYLPDVAVRIRRGDQITLRHLLNHTSGVYNYTSGFSDLQFLLLESNTRQWEPEEVLDLAIDRDYNSIFAPGTRWSYSNTNYLLAGMVIEAATGTSAAEQIRQRIIEPLGMGSTYLADAEPATAHLIDNHTLFSGSWGSFDYNASSFWTAGAMVSSAPDLIAFARAVYSGQIFARSDSLEQLLDFVPTDDEGFPGYGLGVIQFSEDPLTYGHDGVLPGFLSIVGYAPDVDTVVVCLVNSDAFMSKFDNAQLTAKALQIVGLTNLELPEEPKDESPLVLEDPIDPAFQPGDAVTLPSSPFQQLMYPAPGDPLAMGACYAGTTVAILQMGSLEGMNYYEIDCMGMIGWVTADQLE